MLRRPLALSLERCHARSASRLSAYSPLYARHQGPERVAHQPPQQPQHHGHERGELPLASPPPSSAPRFLSCSYVASTWRRHDRSNRKGELRTHEPLTPDPGRARRPMLPLAACGGSTTPDTTGRRLGPGVPDDALELREAGHHRQGAQADRDLRLRVGRTHQRGRLCPSVSRHASPQI